MHETENGHEAELNNASLRRRRWQLMRVLVIEYRSVPFSATLWRGCRRGTSKWHLSRCTLAGPLWHCSPEDTLNQEQPASEKDKARALGCAWLRAAVSCQLPAPRPEPSPGSKDVWEWDSTNPVNPRHLPKTLASTPQKIDTWSASTYSRNSVAISISISYPSTYRYCSKRNYTRP